MPSPTALPSEPRPRLSALDVARGAAVGAMVVYHTAWDLSFLGLVATDVVASPRWSLFARAIAASFLSLAGIGLVLAHGGGVRWRPFLRRLGIVSGAALGVTLATWLVFPDTFVFFGILHCIVASSLLALPFLRAPLAVVALAAAAGLAAPTLVSSPFFDAPLLRPTGLGTTPPATNDWVPVFPWFGWVLIGLLAARIGLRRGWPVPDAPRPTGLLARALGWSGRRSLPIYLLHQPLVFGFLFLAAQVIEPEETVERPSFLAACEISCRDTGRADVACADACRCVAAAAEREGLWSPMVRGRLGERERERVLAFTEGCFRAGQRPTPPE